MNNLEKKKEMFILEAQKIFADAKEHTNYDLIGYFRLMKYVCKISNSQLNSKIKIATIQKLLNRLSDKQRLILKRRYWEGYTRVAIGDCLGVTNERIRQIENDALERLKFLVQGNENTEVNPTIELLRLKPRGYWSLKRCGINTIEQLVRLSRKDLLCIKGISIDSAQNIMQELNEYMTCIAPANKLFIEKLPIDILQLSNRSTNALKRNGIVFIGQLFDLSLDELYRMKRIGVACRKEILKKKQEVVSKYN